MASVQAAALRVLARVDRERLVPALIDVFTDVNAFRGQQGSDRRGHGLMDEYLGEEEVALVNEGVRAKEEQRDAALGRFSGEVEWWRHES